jgi:hypothetical protein
MADLLDICREVCIFLEFHLVQRLYYMRHVHLALSDRRAYFSSICELRVCGMDEGALAFKLQRAPTFLRWRLKLGPKCKLFRHAERSRPLRGYLKHSSDI